MSGPFKLKYKNSAFPFKSPLKHNALYGHNEPHSKKDQEYMDNIYEGELESDPNQNFDDLFKAPKKKGMIREELENKMKIEGQTLSV